MSTLAEILFGGLFVGSLYATMAVGLALIWTTIGVFNFSHGVFMMLGAYLTWTLTNSEHGLGLPFYLALPLGIAASGAIGWLLQALFVRPFIVRRDIVLLVVIVTLAASSFFENGAQEIWGPRPKQLPPLLECTAPIFGITA